MQLNAGKSELAGKDKKHLIDRIFELFISKSKTKEEDRTETEEINQLLQSIYDTRREWERANMNFEYAECQEAVDYYTYTIKANEIMYEYLIKKAKEKGVKVDFIESIESSFNKNMV